MSAARIARARRQVDDLHQLATAKKDPVAFMRAEQSKADIHYAYSGDSNDLALCHALSESLDGERIRC